MIAVDTLPSISVVVGTRDRSRGLPEVLTPFLEDPAATEVVVVDDGSRDGTAALLEELALRHDKLVPVRASRGGKNGTRQEGIERATGEVVLLVDDDVVAAPGLAAAHAGHHARATGLVVMGYMPVGGPEPLGFTERQYATTYEEWAGACEREPDGVLENLWGGNVSVRREDALSVPLESDYDAGYNADRDWGLRCLKAGLVGRFDRGLAAEHRYRRPLADYRRDAAHSGEGRWLIHERHADVVGPLSSTAFEEGLPPMRRLIVRQSRRPRPRRLLRTALTALIARVGGRLQRAGALLLFRIEQQEAALARGARAGGEVPVSVVIPAYNRPEMVARAVRSARAQTRPPAEILVIDDCSSDDTGAAAAREGATVIRHEVNQGEGGSRNTGVRAATQPWIALLDSDDEWQPEHLATLWPLRGDNVLVGASCIGMQRGGGPGRVFGNPGRPRRIESPASLVFPENFIPPSAVMLRADALRAAGPFDTSLKMCADLDLWLRVLEQGPGFSVPDTTAIYHVHGGQVSSDGAAMNQAHLGVVESYSGRSWFSAAQVQRFVGSMAWDEARAALDQRAWSAAMCAFARLGRSPRRMAGVARLMWWRKRLRARGAALTDAASGS